VHGDRKYDERCYSNRDDDPAWSDVTRRCVAAIAAGVMPSMGYEPNLGVDLALDVLLKDEILASTPD
jgi:hypothetical protein